MPESYAWECQDCRVIGELIARNDKGEEISRHIPEVCPLCGSDKVWGLTLERYEAEYGEEE